MERPSQTETPDESPLTRGQQVLWSAQLRHPDAPLYNMAFTFAIDGPVDPPAFARAFGRLVEQCDALRTTVESAGGVPRQRVHDTLAFELPVVDFSAEADPAGAFRAWAQARCERRFDIERIMFDAALARLGDDRYAWFLNQHHIVSDAWSVAVLFERLRLLYEGERSGDGGPAEPLPAYADYRAFEATAQPDDEQRAHWARYRTAPVATPALYGRRPAAGSTRNERVPFELGPERSERLRAFALRPGVRALTLDLAVFRLITTVMFAYLHRAGGVHAITIGAPAHNRVTHDFKESAGLFTEVFPLRVDLDDEETFATLHEKVRDETDAFLRASQPGASDPAMNRSVNAVVNYIRGRFGAFDGAPVRTEWLHPGHVDAEHHVRLQVHDFDGTGCFTLHFDFNCDVFDEALRPEAIEHFVRLLDALLDDWEQPIAGVGLLTAEQRRRVHDAGERVDAPRDDADDVVSLFAAQVAATPDATAVECGDRRWSYHALDAEASAIAAAIEPGSVVGLLTRRSGRAVAAMLGVLKAGAAYVPIDPAWPSDRVAVVLADAGCALVLTDAPRDVAVPVVAIDALATGATAGGAPPGPRGGDDLAYMIYTSGSTGRPKGVMIEHRALANYVLWAREHYDGGRRLTFPLFTPLTFDLTVTSIFVPLASGGTIVVYPETGSHADLAVQAVFDEDRVDIVKLTPSHLALFQDRELSGSRIGQLILGGEELLTPVARRAHDRFGGGVTIHNEYGPTEATVGCVVHTFDPGEDRAATVPIGRAIANMRAHVLDPRGHPVPFGVVGELCVGGAGLARGYANHDALTSERFVAGDAVGEPRLYRTGDRARLRRDGVLEYLGRGDGQVKIRGARIELAEVQAVIAAHPEVSACAATVHRRTLPPPGAERILCRRCGLGSDYPGVSFDAEGVCSQCRSFEAYGAKARVYFKSMDELAGVFARSRDAAAGYDCIALLSGGKDSTYVLCRLVDMGLRVLAFTLDNGYISEQAKGNIRRVVETLGVDHVFGETPAMNAIFVDSLQRHANVCQGCFKTIYTLSLQLAREKKIPFIVTGLSRGQFFETRLTEDLFTELTVSVERIDADVLEARKAYHRVDDAVHRLMDVSMFGDDRIFDEVQFVDFYRYCDVELDELLAYLDERVPWVRPSDTGRSTNCLINDVGIYVHKQLRGFHNYALPYSWDVRMGHKTRPAALEELDDEIDLAAVQRILDEIGYPEDVLTLEAEARLVAYYVASRELSPTELRRHAARRLPGTMVPAQYVRVEAIPLTPNGKIDRAALPEPEASRPALEAVFVAPRTDAERTLAAIWTDVLGIDRVGVRDGFFDLGGDSIMAIQIVARAHRAGVPITLAQLFDALTVEQLAAVSGEGAAAAERVVGDVPLTPAQHWLLAQQPSPERFNLAVVATLPDDADPARIGQALAVLADHHDALRQCFVRDGEGWRSTVNDEAVAPSVSVLEASPREAIDGALGAAFDLGRAPLLRAAVCREGAASRLVLVAHHAIVDAVSWSVLLDDLAHVHGQLVAGAPAGLPGVTTSIRQWVASLAGAAAADDGSERAAWIDIVARAVRPVPARAAEAPDTVADTETVRADLDAARTAQLLHEAPLWRVGVDELLVAALAMTLSEWTDEPAVRVILEGHGRESSDAALDVTRTLGWLTSIYPMTLDVPTSGGAGAIVRAVKEQLRRVPHTGKAYGAFRYLDPDAARRDELALSGRDHVLFNYLGRVDPAREGDRGFRLAGPIELVRAPGTRRLHLLEVTAVVAGERTEIEWCASRRRHDRATIESRAQRFVTHLATLMDACAAGEADTPSASDFPLAKLDEAGLGKLASLLERQDKKP